MSEKSKSECNHIQVCPLFALFTQKGFLEIWLVTYCRGDFSKCARYQLRLQGREAALTLLPNGDHLKSAKAKG